MTAILSQGETLDQEQEEFATVSTTSVNWQKQKFPGRPIAVVRAVRSVAQTSAKDISTEAKKYYLLPNLSGLERVFLPPQPYELSSINDQSEELRTDDIAVYDLTRSIVEPHIGFVQALEGVRRGKFLASMNLSSVGLPRTQSKFQKVEVDAELEADDEEVFWRGVFVVPHQHKVLFRKEIEIKANELPTWKPNVVIDSYRLEDDNE